MPVNLKQQLYPGMPQGGATGSRAQAETLCLWVSQTIAVFSRQKERWQSNIMAESQATKSASWSFLLLSGGGNPKWAPHLAFHGKCVFIIPGQGTKRPLTTGSWLISAKTHWLHKENGFHFVWWRTQDALGRGWLTRTYRKTAWNLSLSRSRGKPWFGLDYWAYRYQTEERNYLYKVKGRPQREEKPTSAWVRTGFIYFTNINYSPSAYYVPAILLGALHNFIM